MHTHSHATLLSHLTLTQTQFVPFQKAADDKKRNVNSIEIRPADRFVTVQACSGIMKGEIRC